MRIAICDDNALDRALIMDLLQQYLEDRSIRCELTGYEDGVTLICDMEDGLWFDAVFLDIYMRGLLGIEVARRLRSLHLLQTPKRLEIYVSGFSLTVAIDCRFFIL